jgi:hypothetical protein
LAGGAGGRGIEGVVSRDISDGLGPALAAEVAGGEIGFRRHILTVDGRGGGFGGAKSATSASTLDPVTPH